MRSHFRLVLSPATGRLERVFSAAVVGVLAAAVSPSAPALRASAVVTNDGTGLPAPQSPPLTLTLDEIYRRCAEEHLRSFNAARDASLPFAKAIAEANHCADVLRAELMAQWRANQP